MQYRYKPILDTTGKPVLFAVEKNQRVRLWHVHNVYNGDLRAENKESDVDAELERLLPEHLPPAVKRKFGTCSIGGVQQTPDIDTNRDMVQYFRKLAGLPRIELKVKPRA